MPAIISKQRYDSKGDTFCSDFVSLILLVSSRVLVKSSFSVASLHLGCQFALYR